MNLLRLARLTPLLIGLTAGPAAWAADTHSLFDDPVVARGKGFEIKQSEIEDAVIGLKAAMATQRQDLPSWQLPTVRERMLDRMILTRILAQRATADDKAKAKQEADKFLAGVRSRAVSEDSYRRQLMAVGIKPEVFEARALEQATVETIIRREIRDTITVSDDQVRLLYDQGLDLLARDVQTTIGKMEASGQTNSQFYIDAQARLADVVKTNLAGLDQPETVRASVMMVYLIDSLTREPLPEDQRTSKRKRLEAALARLKAGEEFAKVAREVSEDPEVQRNGGEYTTTRSGVGFSDLAQALFSLPVGEISGIISVPQGLYVVKVLEHTPAGKVPFEKAEANLRGLLLDQAVERRLPAYYDKLKQEFNVEILPVNSQ